MDEPRYRDQVQAAHIVVAQLVNPDLLEEAKPVELDIGHIIFGSQTPLNHAVLREGELFSEENPTGDLGL